MLGAGADRGGEGLVESATGEEVEAAAQVPHAVCAVVEGGFAFGALVGVLGVGGFAALRLLFGGEVGVHLFALVGEGVLGDGVGGIGAAQLEELGFAAAVLLGGLAGDHAGVGEVHLAGAHCFERVAVVVVVEVQSEAGVASRGHGGHASDVPQPVRGALRAVAGRQLAERRQVLAVEARPGFGEVHDAVRQLAVGELGGIPARDPHQRAAVPAADPPGALAPLMLGQVRRLGAGGRDLHGPFGGQAPRPVAHRETATLGVGHQRVALLEVAALPGHLVPEPFQAHRHRRLGFEAHMPRAVHEFHACHTTNTCTKYQVNIRETDEIHSKSPTPNNETPHTVTQPPPKPGNATPRPSNPQPGSTAGMTLGWGFWGVTRLRARPAHG